MGYFGTMLLRKIISSKQLNKVQVRDGQMGKGGPKGRQPDSCDCHFSPFVDFAFLFFPPFVKIVNCLNVK